jgi:hypothetical protein
MDDWSPEKEKKFLDWYSVVSRQLGLDPNPDDPRHFYDYRRAWENDAAIPSANTGYHFPSKFKHPNHPNRYVDGVDTITGEKVAHPRYR